MPRAAQVRVAQPSSITVTRPASSGGAGVPRGAGQPARGRLEIVRRWGVPADKGWLAFAVLFGASVALWPARFFATEVAYPVLHACLAVPFLYWCVVNLVNRTRIVLDGATLTLRHGPLPAGRGQDLDLARIGRFLVQRLDTPSKNGGMYSSYSLSAEVDGVPVDLVGGLQERDEADYLAQVIEEHLGLTNAAPASPKP